MATELHLIDVLLKMALSQQHPIPNTKALLKSPWISLLESQHLATRTMLHALGPSKLKLMCSKITSINHQPVKHRNLIALRNWIKYDQTIKQIDWSEKKYPKMDPKIRFYIILGHPP